MLLGQLEKRELIRPPEWLVSNTHYLTLMGSQAYGVSNPDSDFDCYGFVIPRKEVLFPHTAGVIYNYDNDFPKFDVWEQQHIWDEDKKREYDFAIYNIVKYFYLLKGCNPNIIDSLFTSEDCVLHCTEIGRLLRDNRRLFLHKKAWHTFRGYSFAQWNKIKKEKPVGKRKEIVDKYGWDIKFGYHLIRLLEECIQILQTHDLDLRLNNHYYISIRQGNIPLVEVEAKFFALQKTLEKLYMESTLPYGPDEIKIKELLLKCLEHHFGSLDKCIRIVGREETLLRQIKELVKDY